MNKAYELLTFIVCATIVIVSAVFSIGYYNINDRALMSKNISEAVAKGMDPLSVRCSYTNSTDTVCVAYAASKK
jgi:hypothetical protein